MAASTLPQGGASVTVNNGKMCKLRHQSYLFSAWFGFKLVFLHYAIYGLYRNASSY